MIATTCCGTGRIGAIRHVWLSRTGLSLRSLPLSTPPLRHMLVGGGDVSW